MKHDVRHHAVGPLAGEQGFDLGPGTRLVECRPAERDQAGIPVPLKRVQPPGRPCKAAQIIAAQDGPSAFRPCIGPGLPNLSFLGWTTRHTELNPSHIPYTDRTSG